MYKFTRCGLCKINPLVPWGMTLFPPGFDGSWDVFA